MKILITGATGFLGNHLVRQLSEQGHELVIHSRQSETKISAMFSGLKGLTFVQGDLTSLDIISNEAEKNKLIDEVELVIHAAALYDLKAGYQESFMQNVVGTQNVIHFIRSLKKLKAFYYISTIAVGDPEQFFLEEDVLHKRDKFDDHYSETKYLAELCVRESVSEKYVTRIIRPAIIVGDTQTGEMPKVDGPYYFIEAFKKFSPVLKKLPFLAFAFNPRTKIPLIPVDHCARFISLIIARDTYLKNLKTYHLISPDGPSLSEFLNDINNHLGIRTHYFPISRTPLNKILLQHLGIPKGVESFMFSKLSYDKTSTLEDLPELEESSYSQFKNILFK